MNCREVKELLADYLGDELGPAQRHGIREHLAACALCREDIAGLSGVLTELKQVPDVSADQAVALTRGLGGGRAESARPGRWRLAAVRYAAVLMLGIGLGFLLRSHWAGGTGPRPAALQSGAGSAVLASLAGGGRHPCWLNAARELPADGSGGGSLAWQLALLSRPAPCR
jgi:anti-sigma factor RsiW